MPFARTTAGINKAGTPEMWIPTLGSPGRCEGGELGSTIQGRDDAVWVVVIEPEGLIVKPDRHGSSTYATYQVAFRKTDGGVVGVSYRFPGKATVVPMTEDNKVARD